MSDDLRDAVAEVVENCWAADFDDYATADAVLAMPEIEWALRLASAAIVTSETTDIDTYNQHIVMLGGECRACPPEVRARITDDEKAVAAWREPT